MPGRIYNMTLLGSDSQYMFDLMSHLNVQVNDFPLTVTLLLVDREGGVRAWPGRCTALEPGTGQPIFN